MLYCFDSHGFHTGWIELERSAGRSDITTVEPPNPSNGKAAQWNGTAWHLVDVPGIDRSPELLARAWAAADAFAQAGMDNNSRFSMLDLDHDPDCPAWRRQRIDAVKAWWATIWHHYAAVRVGIIAGSDVAFDPAVPGPCPWSIWQLVAE